MFFTTLVHRARFLQAMHALDKIHGQELDPAYSAAIYLLTMEAELWSKAKDSVSKEDIAFEDILNTPDVSREYVTLVRLAGHLFDSRLFPPIDLLEVTGLSETAFKGAMQAIELRRYTTLLDDLFLSLG